jgi:hypothetical protein
MKIGSNRGVAAASDNGGEAAKKMAKIGSAA